MSISKALSELRETARLMRDAEEALQRKREREMEERRAIVEARKMEEIEIERLELERARARVLNKQPSIQGASVSPVDVDIYALGFVFGRISSEIKVGDKMLRGAHFTCLGCGTGMPCFAAALLREFQEIQGVENDEQVSLEQTPIPPMHVDRNEAKGLYSFRAHL